MPRFTLRDVFWLTLVVGLSLALWQSWWHDGKSLRAVVDDNRAREKVLESLLRRCGFEADWSAWNEAGGYLLIVTDRDGQIKKYRAIPKYAERKMAENDLIRQFNPPQPISQP